ncbi:restriction endonuclease [Kitasatospora cineracea]|uniref:Restriction system protein n=1 Tax=Kitasatospora cineracea TaxID=88074 RepID=A0A8G1UDA7_9ACTN|nr:restriction endonuclease [Kitasatospora cineracea]ROR38675.1 restriction system protein [Kitasatospora cineracea]
MQHPAEGSTDGTTTVLQPGFLASLFHELGADEDEDPAAAHPAARPGQPAAPYPGPPTAIPPQPGPADPADAPAAADDPVAAHGRAAALTHHRTLAVQADHRRLADLLRRAAQPVSAMDFESQLRSYQPKPFPDAGPEAEPEPAWADFAPPEPAGADPDQPRSRRLLDSGYQRELAQARLRHQRALREWRTRQAELADSGAVAARQAHEEAERARARAVQEYNDSLEQCRRAYRQAEPAAVESLLERALAAAEGATQDLPAPCRAVFRALTRTAVLDLDLPPLDTVPALSGYRLTEAGAVEPVPRPAADVRTDYLRLAARLALRALQAADAVDTEEVLAGVVLNGWLRVPGQPPQCLLSVDADRDALARTRLVPDAGHLGDEGADGGVYAEAEHDESLLRLRALAAVITPDPYAGEAVLPWGSASSAVPALGELSPGEFAHLVRAVLTAGGLRDWSVRLRGPAGLVATAEGEPDSRLPGRWVVWASRGPAPVAAEEIATLAEAVREEGADRGLRMTCGQFTDEALDLTGEERHQRIHLMDGPGIRELARTHLALPLTL